MNSDEKSAPKKKKRHTGLIIFLSLFIILIVLPVILLYALFYDGTTSSFKADDNVSTNTLIADRLASSLDNTKNDGKISVAVTEDDFNQLLYYVNKTYLSPQSDVLKNLYVDINNGEYDFFLDVEVPLFKTRLEIKTTLAEVDGATPEDGTIVFTIKDIQIGRTGGMGDIAFSIGGKYLNDTMIEESFASNGLSVESDLANKKITYKKSSFAGDIKKIIDLSSDDAAIYSSLLGDALDQGLVDFDPKTNNELSLRINLESLHENSLYGDSSKNLNLELEACRSNLETLIDNDIVAVESGNLKNAFEYLVKGYDRSSKANRDYVKNLDLSSISISDYTAYQGAPELTYSKTMDASILDQITLAGLASGKIGQIKETTINDIIKTTDLVGYSFLFEHEATASKSQANYITIDNFYSNVTSTGLSLVVGVNFSGYETTVALATDAGVNENGALKLTVDKVYFGNKETSATLKSDIYALISTSISSVSSWMSFDEATGVITLDFASIIGTSPLLSSLDKSKLSITLQGANLASEGYLDIAYSL